MHNNKDEILKRALEDVMQEEFEEVPNARELERMHIFTDKFVSKMKLILIKQKRQKWQHFSRYATVAAAVLILIVAGKFIIIDNMHLGGYDTSSSDESIADSAAAPESMEDAAEEAQNLEEEATAEGALEEAENEDTNSILQVDVLESVEGTPIISITNNHIEDLSYLVRRVEDLEGTTVYGIQGALYGSNLSTQIRTNESAQLELDMNEYNITERGSYYIFIEYCNEDNSLTDEVSIRVEVE